MSVKPLICAASLAAACLVSAPLAPLQGWESAQAKQFYTRKKVGGRWVTGRFPATARVGRGRRHFVARAAAPPPQEADETASPPPRPGNLDQAPVSAQADRPADARAPAGVRSLAALSTASVTPAGAVPADVRMERMRSGLEARAKSLASDAQPAAPDAPPPAPVGVTMRSVTFDFERGVKTVVFDDNIAVTEPLDPRRARELAAASSR